MDTNRDDAETIGLNALIWTLGDDVRAERLLQLTGLTVEGLRARAHEPAVLAAVLTFLENNEDELVACARAIDRQAIDLVHARVTLEKGLR